MAGYFGAGIYHNKCKRNIGTPWRSAIIKLPGKYSMNVSTAGKLVMYDRQMKSVKRSNNKVSKERI